MQKPEKNVTKLKRLFAFLMYFSNNKLSDAFGQVTPALITRPFKNAPVNTLSESFIDPLNKYGSHNVCVLKVLFILIGSVVGLYNAKKTKH